MSGSQQAIDQFAKAIKLVQDDVARADSSLNKLSQEQEQRIKAAVYDLYLAYPAHASQGQLALAAALGRAMDIDFGTTPISHIIQGYMSPIVKDKFETKMNPIKQSLIQALAQQMGIAFYLTLQNRVRATSAHVLAVLQTVAPAASPTTVTKTASLATATKLPDFAWGHDGTPIRNVDDTTCFAARRFR